MIRIKIFKIRGLLYKMYNYGEDLLTIELSLKTSVFLPDYRKFRNMMIKAAFFSAAIINQFDLTIY